MIKALCFDFDGVLAETLPYHLAAWKKVFCEHGIDVDAMVVRLNEGAPAWKIGQAIALNAGVEFSEKELVEIAQRKNEMFRTANKAAVYEGVWDLIKWSKCRGLKLALVTGTAYDNLKAVLPESLLAAFDAIVKDGDTERGKPHPEPYLLAAKKLGLKPSECLVLENAPLGIRSAKAAGAFCVALMTTLPADRLDEADVVVRDHMAVLEKFEKLLGRKASS